LRRFLLPLVCLVVAAAAGLTAYHLVSRAASSGDVTAAATTSGGTAGEAGGGATADGAPDGRFKPVAATPAIAGLIVSDPQGDVDLGRYKGKALLINIWATWCPPCVAEMPSLDRLQAKLGSDHFAVVPVAVDEPNMAAVQDFISKHQLQNLPVLLDMNHAIDHRVRLQSLPASLLVSPDGLIVARFTGDNKWDCGKPLAAIEAFVKDGTIPKDQLDPCTD
jgi:thiol-disulfide isomerase/thioredoxin